MNQWEYCFAQDRTLSIAIRQAIGFLCCMCRGTISQSIVFNGRDQLDWGSEYKLHSRAPWKVKDLFKPVVKETADYFDSDFIAIGVDDTRLKKTGKCIPGTQYHRDPLSPLFHTNFIWGLRMLNASTLIPLHKDRDEPVAARGIPVRFDHVPVKKKNSSIKN